jgi:hypothetical protein
VTLPSGSLLPGPSSPATSSRDLTLTGRLEPDRITGSIGDDVPRHIPISLGAIEYITVDLADSAGQDLTGATVQMSLGSLTAPGAWLDPDVVTNPSTSTVLAKLLVGEQYTPAAGVYWVWGRVVDSPEILPARLSLTPIEIS